MPPLTIHLAIGLDKGRVRPANEDAVAYHYPTDWALLVERGVLLLVADGVGSLQAGELASQRALEFLIAAYYDRTRAFAGVEQHLRQVVEQANTVLYERHDTLGATTLVAAVIRDNTLTVTHVGDSRLYWLTDTQPPHIEQITSDHSYPVPQKDGRIKMKLTQALGYAPQVTLTLPTRTLAQGHRLLLMTDGITRYLDADQLARYAAAEPEPLGLVTRLINAANQFGGVDNIGVVVAHISGTLANANDLAGHLTSLGNIVYQPATSVPLATAAALPADSYSQRAPTPEATPMLPAIPQAGPAPRGLRRWFMLIGLIGVVGLAAYWQVTNAAQVVDVVATTGVPATPNSLLAATVPATSQLTEQPTRVEVITVQFEQSGRTYTRIGSDVVAFILEAGQSYEWHDEHTLADGTQWVRLFDLRNERYGWIEAAQLPQYQRVER